MATDQRTCDVCGASLQGKRADAVFCSVRCRVKARRDADRLQQAMWAAAQAIAAKEKRDEARRRERRRGPPRAAFAVRERDKRERIEARERAALSRLLSSLEKKWRRASLELTRNGNEVPGEAA